MKLKEAYLKSKEALIKKNIPNASAEAVLLCEFVFNCSKNDILLGEKDCRAGDIDALEDLIKKRADGYPLQYIIGSWDFYGLPFYVGEGVLIPRADTELLAELSIKKLNGMIRSGRKVLKFLDICSGSGCIAVAVKKYCPEVNVFALEKSESALFYLKQNAELNKVNINIICADALFPKKLNDLPLFDIIVSNPPYLTEWDMKKLQTEVKHEPFTALFGGCDGLDFFRELTSIWKNKLTENGTLAYEIGVNQEYLVEKILISQEFTNIEKFRDLNGIIRNVCATFG